MRSLRRPVVALLFALCFLYGPIPAYAQTVNHSTNVTLSTIRSNGQPVANGLLCAVAADQHGAPLAFSEAGWGIIAKNSPFCATVTSGLVPAGLNVPDAQQSNLAGPLLYTFTLQLTDANGNATGSPVVIYNAVPGVTGTAFALDTYTPPATTLVATSNTFGYGSSVPDHCTSPSIWTMPGSASVLVCANGVYVAPTGSAVVIGTTPGTVMAGNDSRVLNAVKNQGAWSATLNYSINDMVTVGTGSTTASYISIAAGLGTNTNNPPATSPAFWQALSDGGASALAAAAAAQAAAIAVSAQKANNLSDLASPSVARTSLGLGTAATTNSTAYDASGAAATAAATAQAAAIAASDPAGSAATAATAAQAAAIAAAAATAAQRASNLSDLASPATARTNLGLGSAATTSSTAYDASGAAATAAATAQAAAIAASDPAGSATAAATAAQTAAIAAAAAASAQRSSNLSDLANASVARTNLGLGSAATQPSSAFDSAGAAAAAEAAAIAASAPAAAATAWSSTATYLVSQSVLYNGTLWQALTPVPANQTPAVGSSYWTPVAAGPNIGTTNSAERFFYTGTPAPAPAAGSVGYQQAVPVTSPYDIGAAGAAINGVLKRVPTTTATGIIDQDTLAVSGTDFDAPGAAAAAQAAAIAASDPAGSATTAATAAQAAAIAVSAQKANNLSDLASAPAARTNLGLGSAAVQAASFFDLAGLATAGVVSLTNMQTAGAAGVLANTLVVADGSGSNPVKLISATAPYSFLGVALTAASAGGQFQMADATGDWQIRSGAAITAGDILIQCAANPSYACDSGQPANAEEMISIHTRIIGVAMTSATASLQLVTVNPDGRGMRGSLGQDYNPQAFGMDCSGINTVAQQTINTTALNAILSTAGLNFTNSLIATAAAYEGTDTVIGFPSSCVSFLNGSGVLPSNASVALVSHGANGARLVAGSTMGSILSKDGGNVVGTLDIENIILDGANLASNCLVIGTEKEVDLNQVSCFNTTSTPMIFGDNVSTYNFGVNSNKLTIRFDASAWTAGTQPAYSMITQGPVADANFHNSQLVNFKTAGIYNTAGEMLWDGTHGGGFSGTGWAGQYLLDDESLGGTRFVNSYCDGIAVACFRVGGTNNNGSIFSNNQLFGSTSPGAVMGSFSASSYGLSVIGNEGHNMSGVTSMFTFDTIGACNGCAISGNTSNLATGSRQEIFDTVLGASENWNVPNNTLPVYTSYLQNHVLAWKVGMGTGTNPAFTISDNIGTTSRARIAMVPGGDTQINAGLGGSIKICVVFATCSGPEIMSWYQGGNSGSTPALMVTLSEQGIYNGPPVEASDIQTTIIPPPTVTITPSATGGTLTAAASPYTYYVESGNGVSHSGPSVAATCTIPSGTTGSCLVAFSHGIAGLGDNCGSVYGRTLGSPGLISVGCQPYLNTTQSLLDTGSATPTTGMPVYNTSGGVYGTHLAAVGVPTITSIGSPGAAGTGATFTQPVGDDDRFTFTITTGSTGTLTTGTLATYAFANPHIAMLPGSDVHAAPVTGTTNPARAAESNYWIGSTYPSGGTIYVGTVLAPVTTYTFLVTVGNK